MIEESFKKLEGSEERKNSFRFPYVCEALTWNLL